MIPTILGLALLRPSVEEPPVSFDLSFIANTIPKRLRQTLLQRKGTPRHFGSARAVDA